MSKMQKDHNSHKYNIRNNMQLIEYLNYIVRHKKLVLEKAFEAGEISIGIFHDLSKFMPDEFFPFMRWNYSIYGRKAIGVEYVAVQHARCKASFEKALRKHYLRNKHHWNHWVYVDEFGSNAVQMPEKYMKEMVLDWRAMSKAFTNDVDNTKNWYLGHRDSMVLHPLTKLWLDAELLVD